ncbi:MAG: hypothetical protein ABL958_07905, partial [Bdellovibrionia bacterium]
MEIFNSLGFSELLALGLAAAAILGGGIFGVHRLRAPPKEPHQAPARPAELKPTEPKPTEPRPSEAKAEPAKAPEPEATLERALATT